MVIADSGFQARTNNVLAYVRAYFLAAVTAATPIMFNKAWVWRRLAMSFYRERPARKQQDSRLQVLERASDGRRQVSTVRLLRQSVAKRL